MPRFTPQFGKSHRLQLWKSANTTRNKLINSADLSKMMFLTIALVAVMFSEFSSLQRYGGAKTVTNAQSFTAQTNKPSIKIISARAAARAQSAR